MDNKLLNNSKKSEQLSELGLFITAVIFGGSFPISKVALTYYSPLFLTMTRYLLGGMIMGVFFHKRISQNFAITKRQFWEVTACGAVFYFAYLIQVIGLQYTAPAKQSFLAALYVIMVPFLYWIVYKFKPDIYNFTAAILTLVGIYLLTVNGAGGFNIGDMMTIVGALFYAIHIVLIGYLVKQIDPIILTFLQTSIAGIIGLAVSLIFEPIPTEFPLVGVLSVLYMTIFCTIIAYGLQITCQKYISETKASLILCLESVFGTLLSVIFLDDPFTKTMFVGCIIIFIGILTAQTKWEFLKVRK